ncbi:MAG TPA: hypothetical protein VJ951_06650 [Bacteroidales bacterium]|nr:hypothetical protein [Bacteroidales bacterium]
MKRNVTILSIIAAFFLFNASSCNDTGDEGFTQIKVIETQIYNEIDSYRLNNGISANDPFVHQPLMVKEAQMFSAEMAFGTGEVDTTGLAIHWDNIHDKIGGYNDATLLLTTTASSAAGIVSAWTSDSASSAILLEDYTQCGAGVVTVEDSISYVTVMMMYVESK